MWKCRMHKVLSGLVAKKFWLALSAQPYSTNSAAKKRRFLISLSWLFSYDLKKDPENFFARVLNFKERKCGEDLMQLRNESLKKKKKEHSDLPDKESEKVQY